MPCRSDYMEPTQTEIEKKTVCQLISFVSSKLGKQVDVDIAYGAVNDYGGGMTIDLNKVTEKLCRLVQSLTPGETETIVYNGRSKESRKLADWWEKHQADDKKHVEDDLLAAKDAEARTNALSKLTDYERNLLNLTSLC